MNTADAFFCELCERRRGEVEVELGASDAGVDDLDGDGRVVEACLDLSPADGIVIGVASTSTGEIIEEFSRYTDYQLVVVIGRAT